MFNIQEHLKVLQGCAQEIKNANWQWQQIIKL
jgi:hypothetical protein